MVGLLLWCLLLGLSTCQENGVKSVLDPLWNSAAVDRARPVDNLLDNWQREQQSAIFRQRVPASAGQRVLSDTWRFRRPRPEPVDPSVAVREDRLTRVVDTVADALDRPFRTPFNPPDQLAAGNRIENSLNIFEEDSLLPERRVGISRSLIDDTEVSDVLARAEPEIDDAALYSTLRRTPSPVQQFLGLANRPRSLRGNLVPTAAFRPDSLREVLRLADRDIPADLNEDLPAGARRGRRLISPFKLYDSLGLEDRAGIFSSLATLLDDRRCEGDIRTRHYLQDLLLDLLQVCRCRHVLAPEKKTRGPVLRTLLDSVCRSAQVYLSNVYFFTDLLSRSRSPLLNGVK